MHKNKKYIYQFLLIGLLLFLSGCGGSCDAPLECEPEFGAGGVRGVEWSFSRKGRTCVRDCSTRLFSPGEVSGGTKYSDWAVNNKTGDWTRTHVVEDWEENVGMGEGVIFGDTLFGIERSSHQRVNTEGDSTTEMRILVMDLSENKIIQSYEGNYIPDYQRNFLYGTNSIQYSMKFFQWGNDSLVFSYWRTVHVMSLDKIDSTHSYRWTLDINTGKTSELNLNKIFKRSHLWHGVGREGETLLGGVFLSDSTARLFFSKGDNIDSMNLDLVTPLIGYFQMTLKDSRFEYSPDGTNAKCIDLDIPNRKTIGDWYGSLDTIPNRPRCRE